MRIGRNEMSASLTGIEPSYSKPLLSESQTITKTKTVSTLDHSAIPLKSGVVAK